MLNINTNQIIIFLQNYFKVISAVFLFFVALGLAGLFFQNWNKNQEEKAKDRLLFVQKALQDLVKEPEEKENPFDISEEKELILTDEMKTRAEAYKQAINENKKYKISVYFAIDLADFYYRYGDKETAFQFLSPFSSPLSKNTLSQLVSFQLASYYMNDEKCDLALGLFEKLLSNKFAEGLFLETRLQKGICLENLNRYKEAIQVYDSLSIENPDTYMGRQAKDYKRLLILKQKLNDKNNQ